VRRSPEEIAVVVRAKARLDRLAFYPEPVRIGRVRVLSVPWLFRLKRPLREVSDDLIVHELCHVWQLQHHPIAMPLSYLWQGYRDNPNEIEARRAAAETR
jgi:hypothetical protein